MIKQSNQTPPARQAVLPNDRLSETRKQSFDCDATKPLKGILCRGVAAKRRHASFHKRDITSFVAI
jgi:hypothetical protein